MKVNNRRKVRLMRASRKSIVVLAVWLVFVIFGGQLFAHGQTFQHPGVLVSQAQLNYMKIMVQAHQDPFYSAFIKAQNSSSGSLTYSQTISGNLAITGGLIVCGSTSNPNYGCSNSDDDGTAAYVQALLWYITGNQTYANNAIALMDYYAANVVGYGNVGGQVVGGVSVSSSNTPLQAAWDSQKWPRAAEIIRYSNAGWPAADAAAFGQWMNNIMVPQLINGTNSNGNWETSMIEGLIGIGVYNDDAATFNTGVTYWKQRIPAIFYHYTDGGQPIHAPRGTASWYGQILFDPSMSGVQQETCRDFGHAQYSLSGSLDAAETAYIQGINLYQDLESITDSAQGTFNVNAQNRFTAALEFNAYYLLNNPVPPTGLCDLASQYQSVANNSITKTIYPVDEIGYNEYHNRLGINLPLTLQYLNTTIRQLPDPTEYHIMVYESLTHGGDASQLQPFMMWSSATSSTIQSGSSATFTVNVVPGSATNAAVTLSVSGLPSGVTYGFSPSTVTGAGTSTLTFTASSLTASGSYALSIIGTSSTSTYTLPLTLLVSSPTANFSIAAAPAVVSAVAGDVASFPITLTPISSYMGTVTLSVASGLPAGATATFSSPTVTSSSPNSTVNVLTTGLTVPGAYSLTISGTDGVLTNTTKVQLIVGAISNACIQKMGYYWVTGAIPPQTGIFTAEWDATPSLTGTENANVGLTNVNMATVDGSATYTDLVLAARFNPTGTIDGRNGAAFGVPSVAIPYTGGLTYHFRAVVNVPAATYSIYVTPPGQSELTIGTNWAFRTGAQVGTPPSINFWDATAQVGSVALCNMVVETPNFGVSSSPASQTVAAGRSVAFTTTVTPIAGYTGSVTLSASGLPSGATASFNPATVVVGANPVSSTMTVTAAASAATGISPITVTATDGTLTQTAYSELTINPACVAPAATSQNLTVAENGAVAVNLAGTLGSGCSITDTLSYAVTANPSHGVLTGTIPNLMYTPTAGYAGSDSLSFTVADSNAVTTTSSAAAVTITVAAPVSGAPILGSVTPAVVVAGSTGIVLTVNGTGFKTGATVLLNGTAKTTTFVSATQVTAALAVSDVSSSGLVAVTVSNPGTSGGVSTSLMLAIDSNIQTYLVAKTASFTVTHGQGASAQLIFMNIPPGALTSADCFNLPTGVNCSYNAQTQMITLTTSLNTPPGAYQILVVGTVNPATTVSLNGHSSQGGLFYAMLGLPFGLMWIGRKRRRWLYPAAGALSLFLIFAVGCGGSKATTPFVTTQASTTLTLTVN
jgi:hypothetical protein